MMWRQLTVLMSTSKLPTVKMPKIPKMLNSSDPLLTGPCRRMTPTSGVFFLKSYHPKPWLDLTTHSSRLLGSRRRRYHQTTQPGQPTSVVTCTYMMLKKYYICEVRIPRLISDACILMLAISKSTF
jgi:hypothetical protein